MQNSMTTTMSAAVAALFLLTGCGGSSSGGDGGVDAPELESEGKSLIFYSASTDEQYAYTVDSATVTNLNDPTDAEGEDISQFNMSTSEKGRLFRWVDEYEENNVSIAEDKVVMFHQDYDYTTDGNATWEDFYYLGHFYGETEGDETHYHLAAHSNDEFNVTSDAKFNAMLRLNRYLQSQESVKNALTDVLPASADGLCTFDQFENEAGETVNYAIGFNGTLYAYDANYTLMDSTVIASACETNGAGMSATEEGVLVFIGLTQKAYLVDSHEDGIYHVHSSWELSEILGSGTSAQMMVGLTPLEHE